MNQSIQTNQCQQKGEIYSVDISYEGGRSFSSSASAKGNASSPAAAAAPRNGRLAAATGLGGSRGEPGRGGRSGRGGGRGGGGGDSAVLLLGTTNLPLFTAFISGIFGALRIGYFVKGGEKLLIRFLFSHRALDLRKAQNDLSFTVQLTGSCV